MRQIRTFVLLTLIFVILSACQASASQYSIIGKWKSEAVQSESTLPLETLEPVFWNFELTNDGRIIVSDGDMFTIEGQYKLIDENKIELSGDIEIFMGKTIYYKFIDSDTIELSYPGVGNLYLHRVN